MRSLIAVLVLSSVTLAASAKNTFIPVAGVVQGANNTFFRTDVRIFNPSDTVDIFVSLHFLPQGIEGSNISGRLVKVPKRQVVVLNDIVGTFFQMQAPAIGAIWLDSDADFSYSYVAESRIYTDSPNPAAPGTYGQFVRAFDVSEAKMKTVVTHLSNGFDYRTNAGVMNPGAETATVTAVLWGADGTKLGETATVEIPPKSMRQMSIGDWFGGAFFGDGFITFESTQPVFTWGSVIDNNSGDQIYVPGVEDKAEVEPIF